MRIFKATNKDNIRISEFLNAQCKNLLPFRCWNLGTNRKPFLEHRKARPNFEVYCCEDDTGQIRVVLMRLVKDKIATHVSVMIDSEDFKKEDWSYFKELLTFLRDSNKEKRISGIYWIPKKYIEVVKAVHVDNFEIIKEKDISVGKIYLVHLKYGEIENLGRFVSKKFVRSERDAM